MNFEQLTFDFQIPESERENEQRKDDTDGAT